MDELQKVTEAEEKVWQNLWNEVFHKTPGSEGWEYPWVLNSSGDGNPVFTAINRESQRAIRIIQFTHPYELKYDGDKIFSYIDEREDDVSIITELVVACWPCHENFAAAEKLMSEWVLQSWNLKESSVEDL